MALADCEPCSKGALGRGDKSHIFLTQKKIVYSAVALLSVPDLLDMLKFIRHVKCTK